MHLSLKSRSFYLFVALAFAGLQAARGQSLTIASGNGQIVGEQFLTQAPLVVLAKDASGKPAPGVAIAWSLQPSTGGTIVRPELVTDADGLARATFLGTSLQPLTSFAPTTVIASSAFGSASFFVTTFLYSGGNAVQPLVELVAPTFDNRNNLTGAIGSTLPGAVVVRVSAASGISAGRPIPNVGVRIVLSDGSGSPGPAACAGPTGLILTDAQGVVTCDLAITGPTGSTRLMALVGELLGTPSFALQVTPGSACSFSISPASKDFGASGGTGSVSVTTSSGCSSTAFSNASWVTITGGNNLVGNGTVTYSVGPNTGGARTALLVIAGQTFLVNQAAGSSGPASLSITSSSLASGTVGSAYSSTVTATGGVPPYTFAVSGTLPAGLSLNASSGVISGTPTSDGVSTFTVSVTDVARSSQSQNFSITISTKGSTSFKISNLSLPNGVVGQPYNQLLQTSGGCITPFSQISRITLASGNPPPGLSLTQASDSSYSIAGTPTTSGTSTFTLSARSPCGETATATYTITVGNSSSPPPPPPATLTASPNPINYTLQQSGNVPGSQIVNVSSSGQPVAYSAVISSGASFLAITEGATGTTPATLTISLTPAAGALSPGNYNGAVTITPAGGGSAVTISVSLNVTAAPPANLLVNPPGLTFTSPGPTGAQSFQQNLAITSSGTSLHYGVSATSAGGWLSASPSTGETPGTVSIVVNAAGLPVGSYTGLVAITPPNGAPLNVPVTLTVSAPSPSIRSVINAASFIPGAVAPGEIVVIFGSAIGPATITPLALDPSGGVSQKLATTQVFFDDIPAPLIYTSAGQVSAIVPYEITGRATVRVRLEYQGLRSSDVVLNVVDANPGIFTIDTSGQGAILNQDFSVNTPQNGAAPESVVSIFGTGEGQTNPIGATGKITATVLSKPVLPVSVQIDGQTADVLYAGSAPGLPAGALQVNAKIPASVRRGVSVPVVITVGTASSQAGVTLFVSP